MPGEIQTEHRNTFHERPKVSLLAPTTSSHVTGAHAAYKTGQVVTITPDCLFVDAP